MKHFASLLALTFGLLVGNPSSAMDEADPMEVGLSPLALDQLDKAMAALVNDGRLFQ